MKNAESVSEIKSLQHIVDFENQILQEIEDFKVRIKELKKSKYYTPQIVSELENKEQTIQNNKYLLSEIVALKTLRIGDWVQNGSSNPGRIVDLIAENHSAKVDIQWWQGERNYKLPCSLKVLLSDAMNYIWYGKFEKLIRKCDRFECEDIDILKSEKKIAEEDFHRAWSVGQPKAYLAQFERKITYCKKRMQTLNMKNNFLPKYNQIDLEFASPKNNGITEEQEKLALKFLNKDYNQKQLLSLLIAQIRRNPVCQQRESLDEKVVEEYKECFVNGVKMPPVKVMFDGSIYWLYDGFHTTQAAIEAGMSELQVEVTNGDLRAAILASVSVNSDHGLRRSNQTKRNAVMVLLQDEEWGTWSNREIARVCNLSESLVRKIKEELAQESTTKDDNQIITAFKRSDNLKSDNRTYKDKYGNTSKMDIKNIGNTQNDNSATTAFKRSGITESDKNVASKIEFLPNQLLQMRLSSLEGVENEVKNLNHQYCVYRQKAEVGNGYHVYFFESGTTHIVTSDDLIAVDTATISFQYDAEEYCYLLSVYGSRDKLEAALRKMIANGGRVS